MRLSLVLLATLIACDTSKTDETGSAFDGDGDGWTIDEGDCVDTDASIHPEAAEVCDGMDQNCDGVADEGLDGSVWYPDADGDGYGNAAAPVTTCAPPEGYVEDATDCDDNRADVHPGAEEVPCSGVLESCAGSEGDVTVPGTYADIQAAIDASADGTRICVSAGSWTAFEISHPVAVGAVDGPEATVVLGSGKHVVSIDGVSGAWVRGFTLTGGTEAALHANGADGVHVEDNIVLSGTFSQAPLWVSDSPGAVVAGNEITQARGTGAGALLLSGSDGARIEGNTFDGTTAANGGGVALSDCGGAEVRGNTFHGTSASGDGGGLYVNDVDGLVLGDNLFEGTTAGSEGGALYVNGAADLSLAADAFSNVGASQGSILYATDVKVVALDGVTADGGEAGSSNHHVVLTGDRSSSSALTLTGNAFARLTGGTYTVYAENFKTITSTSNTFEDSTVGGASYYSTSQTTSSGDTLTALDAPMGVATFGSDGDAEADAFTLTDSVFDTGLSLWGTNAILSGATVSGNTSTWEPVLFTTSTADLLVEDVTATGNVTGASGVIHAVGMDIVTRAITLTSNESEGSAGLYVTWASTLLVEDLVASSNVSGLFGALYINNVASGELSGGEVSGNSVASGRGGGLYCSNSKLDMGDTSFHDNTPDDTYCDRCTGCE